MAKRIVRESQSGYTIKLKSDKPFDKPLIVKRKGQRIAALVPIKDYEQFEAWRSTQSTLRASAKKRSRSRRTRSWIELQRALIAREVTAFNAMKPELLRRAKNKWVAMLDGAIVEMADDEQTLLKRAYAKYGDRTMLIRQVTETERVYHVNSPRVMQQ